jgi:hypothetical protein
VSTTDAAGNFEFKNLEAGGYQITVSKAGFVSAGWKARRAGQPSETLMLADGQILKDINFQLTHAA